MLQHVCGLGSDKATAPLALQWAAAPLQASHTGALVSTEPSRLSIWWQSIKDHSTHLAGVPLQQAAECDTGGRAGEELDGSRHQSFALCRGSSARHSADCPTLSPFVFFISRCLFAPLHSAASTERQLLLFTGSCQLPVAAPKEVSCSLCIHIQMFSLHPLHPRGRLRGSVLRTAQVELPSLLGHPKEHFRARQAKGCEASKLLC